MTIPSPMTAATAPDGRLAQVYYDALSNTYKMAAGAEPRVAGVTSISGFEWDMSGAPVARLSLPASGELVLSGARAGSFYVLVVIGNGNALTFPASVKWPDGTAPTISAGTDVLTFLAGDGEYYAVAAQNFS